jgi:DNA-directed RNA polymerase alpha subunit
MLLKLLDRFLLLKALPKEGSYATLKIVQDLKHNLALNEDEFKEYEVKEEEGNIVWNADKDDGKDVPIGEKATDIIIIALKKRDRDGELTEQEIPVYEKFIKGD